MVSAPAPTLASDKQEREARGPGSREGRHLADDEEVLTLHHLLPELLLEGQPHLVLVLVHVSAVDVTVAKVNRRLHSLGHFAWRGLNGKGPEGTEFKSTTKQPRKKEGRHEPPAEAPAPLPRLRMASGFPRASIGSGGGGCDPGERPQAFS